MIGPVRRLVASACLLGLVGSAASAAADKTYRVTIDSSPGGAELRIDDRDAAPVGTTPWTGSLAEGSHMVIVSLADHHELVDEVVVTASKKLQRFKLTLQPIEYGEVDVVSGPPGSKGATVLVDGEPRGEVPVTLRLEVGPHQLEIKREGFRRFERWIEVASGDATEVVAALESTVKDRPPVVHQPAPPRTDPLLVAAAGLEVGWRRFRYTDPMTASARPFDADAVPLLRVDVEVRPLASRGDALGRGLGVAVAAALGFPPAAAAPSGGAIETSWSELAAELRYRHRVGEGIDAGVAGGFARTAFGFSNAGALAGEVPDADYRSLRLAGSLRVQRGRLWFAAEAAYLASLSLGPLADRFRGASAHGLAGSVAAGYRIAARVDATVGGGLRQWSWTLDSQAGDPVVASGSTDRFFGAVAGLSYFY